ncbi:MAG: aminotransferase, partial [Planctomycetota bacterium]
IEQVAAALLEVTDVLCERLESAGAVVASHRQIEPSGNDPRSGVLAFEMPGRDPMAVRGALLDAGVVCSCRGGRVRLSPHAYTDGSDIDRLIGALAGAAT